MSLLLQINPADNVAVARAALPAGTVLPTGPEKLPVCTQETRNGPSCSKSSALRPWSAARAASRWDWARRPR